MQDKSLRPLLTILGRIWGRGTNVCLVDPTKLLDFSSLFWRVLCFVEI